MELLYDQDLSSCRHEDIVTIWHAICLFKQSRKENRDSSINKSILAGRLRIQATL
jgi:hypothetical protein